MNSLSLSAVKKAWSSVYDRAAEHLPDSILAVEKKKNAATATVASRKNNGCLPIYASIPKSFALVRGEPARSRLPHQSSGRVAHSIRAC